jgi:hypothetical protein
MAKNNIAKVENHPDLIRDLSTQAIINTNSGAYEERLEAIAKVKLDKQQSADIDTLKKDMAEIKKLIKNLASK